MKTRDDLDKLVSALAAEYAQRADVGSAEDMVRSLAELQESIQAQASPEDAAHVWGRLQCVLRDAGMIPGDDQPCDKYACAPDPHRRLAEPTRRRA